MSTDTQLLEDPSIPSTWEEEYQRTLPVLDQYKKEIQHQQQQQRRHWSFVEIVRVNQLDGIKLDQEINEVLKIQFMKIFTFMKPEWVDKYQPELHALLQFLIYKYSIFTLGTTYGNLVQNLKFRNNLAPVPIDQVTPDTVPLTTWQKALYGVLTIGGEWGWSRLCRYSVNQGWGDMEENTWQRRAWKILTYLENIYKCLSILNLLVFLRNGQYASVINRLLGMQLVYYKPNMSRRVSFELLNRQLVWLGFSEFLLFLLPLINMDRIKNFLYRRLFTKPRPEMSTIRRSPSATTLLHPPLCCPVCNSDPVFNPYISSCGHIFCYYCLKANCMADSQFPCPKCGKVVLSMKRWSPLDNNSRPS